MLKKKKYKIRPIVYIIVLILIIIIYWIIPKSYEKNYKIDDYNIKELYNNKTKRYNLNISLDNISYDYNFDSNYNGKKIIKKIDNVGNDNYSCIKVSIKDKSDVILCDGIDYHLINEIDFSEFKKEYNNDSKLIDNTYVFNTLNQKYLIWNYNNFSYIDSKDNYKIELFKNDYYNINIATIINDNFVIANYDNSYNFKELIIINLKNKNKEIWQLNFEMSFESYILGTIDNYIYIVDKKNKTEYRLDIKKREMKVVGTENNGGIIYNNGNYEDISMYKLINNDLEFDYGYDQKYIIDNNRLFLNTKNNKVLVSNYNISKIIYQNNNYVYYLVDDILYYHSNDTGEVKIMQNFEWNFNNSNVIFIY